MGTMFERYERTGILQRLARLAPKLEPLWGEMTPEEMLCHQADLLRYALGEKEAKPIVGWMAHRPLNWLVIHVLPWPKAKAASPTEFVGRRNVFDDEVAEVKELVRRFCELGPHVEWPRSPAFGRISGKDWGVLVHKHFDHHLRQFGL